MLNYLKLKKINILLVTISLFFLLNKTNFIKDFYNVLKFDKNSRIINTYGYCGGESIGYLRYLKNKYDFKSNPKVINFIHTPSTLWSIYNTKYSNLESNLEILINYPGNEINIEIPQHKREFFELKNRVYSLGRASKEIIKLSLDDKTINKLIVRFYSYDNLKKMNLFNTVEIIKSSSNNQFTINNKNNKLNIGERQIYLKLISKKGTYTNKSLKLIFENKYQLDKLDILDNYENCYLIKR